MTVFKHEMRLSWKSLLIWSLSIAALMVVCVLLFPEMRGEMEGVSEIFSSMGNFTAAFGMDKLNFGTFIGFYGIECGNILGLGGAFFAALTGIAMLSKEEVGHTAEFLLTHPVSRRRIAAGKLTALLTQVLLLDLLAFAGGILSGLCIGEALPWKELLLLHTAYLLLHLETAALCFGLSAVLRRSAIGLGMGLSLLFYCLNLLANITEKAGWLKYFTPFSYTESADILSEMTLNLPLILLGLLASAAAVLAGFLIYDRKDIL